MSPMPIGRPRFVTTEEALGWHVDACTERGDERLAHGLRQASAVLVTMYRLAEDMGYEW